MNLHETDREQQWIAAHPDPKIAAALQEMHARLRKHDQRLYHIAEEMTHRAIEDAIVSTASFNWLLHTIRDALTHEFSDADVRALEATL